VLLFIRLSKRGLSGLKRDTQHAEKGKFIMLKLGGWGLRQGVGNFTVAVLGIWSIINRDLFKNSSLFYLSLRFLVQLSFSILFLIAVLSLFLCFTGFLSYS